MLTNIKSEHFTRGGTGITNFPVEDLLLFEEAIRLHGNPFYVVSAHPLSSPISGPLAMGQLSLHYIGVPSFHDHSRFWARHAEAEIALLPIRIELTRAQAEALMTVCYCGITGSSSTTGRGRTNEVVDILEAAGIEKRAHYRHGDGNFAFRD